MTTLQKLDTAPDLIKMTDAPQFLPLSYEQISYHVCRGTVPVLRIGKRVFLKKSVIQYILEFGTDGLTIPEQKPIFPFSAGEK